MMLMSLVLVLVRIQSMFLKVYTQYVNHFNKAITIVARLKRTSEDFRAFLMVRTHHHQLPFCSLPWGADNDDGRGGSQYSQNRKQCKGLDLNAFLIMPVQRIPRYVMLLSVRTPRHDTTPTHDTGELTSWVALIRIW
jgi:hypothetical protein